jgi:hypothetical protein
MPKVFMKKMITLLFFISLSFFTLSANAQKIQSGKRFRALIIGIDGMKGVQFYHHAFLKGHAPHIKWIADHGQYATCLTINDPYCAHTHSGPRFDPAYSWMTSSGWASVVTGVNTDKHLIKDNDYENQRIFYQTTRQFPTFFSRLKQKGFITAAGGVGAFVSSLNDYGANEHVSPGILDYECGYDDGKKTSSIATTANTSCNADYRQSMNGHDPERDKKLTQWMVNLIKQTNTQSPDVIMGVYDTVDSAGHHAGFGFNPDYLNAISNVDDYIADLIKAMQQTQDIWLIVITSDHGGHINEEGSGSHGNMPLDDEAVPFITAVIGDTISLKHKGPMHATDVKQMDTAPTVLHWFDMSADGIDGNIRSQYDSML